MSFFSKLIKPAAIIGGSAILGSYLFPETTSYLTGGMLGSDAAGAGASGASYGDMLGKAAGTSSSIWSNPTVLSSGILAGTSLLTNLFGPNTEQATIDLNKASLAEKQREFDQNQELEKAQLAQALEIAKLQSGAAGRAAGITAAANKSIAKANLIANAASEKAKALQLPLVARKNQSDAAQTTGAQSGAFFNQLMAGLQRPALGVQ